MPMLQKGRKKRVIIFKMIITSKHQCTTHCDDVGNSLDALAENVISEEEGILKRSVLIDDIQQSIVGNYDKSVDALLQLLNCF